MRLIIASPSQGFVKMYIKLFKPCLAHGRNYVNAGYYYFMILKGKNNLSVAFILKGLKRENITFYFSFLSFFFWCICLSFFFKNLFIFNWRIIVLQYCVGFCHISTRISHRYIYIPSILNLPPTPYHPSRLS